MNMQTKIIGSLKWVAIGWDTDSYSSILGSMSGALNWDIFPEQYIEEFHPRYRQKLEKTLQTYQ